MFSKLLLLYIFFLYVLFYFKLNQRRIPPILRKINIQNIQLKSIASKEGASGTVVFKARFQNKDVFAKVWCGLNGDFHKKYNKRSNKCRDDLYPNCRGHSAPDGWICNARLLAALAKIAEESGLADIIPKVSFIKAHTTTPDNVLQNVHMAVFDAAPGQSYERLQRNTKKDDFEKLLTKMSPKQIKQIALFDLLTGQMDRHPQNIFISSEGRLMAIDNDQTFVNRENKPEINSVFLPGTEKHEICRVGNGNGRKCVKNGKCKTKEKPISSKCTLFDYRCHMGPIGKDYPAKFLNFLKKIDSMEESAVHTYFNFINKQHTAFLKNRVHDLYILGFEKTLEKSISPYYEIMEPCCDKCQYEKTEHFKSFSVVGLGGTYGQTPTTILDNNERWNDAAISRVGFTVAISQDGRIFTWGRNETGGGGGGHWGGMENTGQLGRGGDKDVPMPIFSDKFFVKVSSGRMHVLAVDVRGNVYSWGGNDMGQLGREGIDYDGNKCHSGVGCRSGVLTQIPFKYIAKNVFASRYASFILTDNGRLFTFGWNKYQYNDISQQNAWKMREIVFDKVVKDIAVGYHHFVVQTTNDVSIHETGGDGYAGRLHSTINPKTFNLDCSPQSVAAGRTFTIVVCKDGTVRTQGIKHPDVHDISEAKAGEYFYILVSKNRKKIHVFGNQLVGKPKNILLKNPVKMVAAGYQSIVLIQNADFKSIDPELYKEMPLKLINKYKNPCWEQRGTLRCLPYYNILGVSKSGTTDLYHRINKHPSIISATNKGPHWWDERRPGNKEGTFDEYVALFSETAKRLQEHPDYITGEASSNTFTYTGTGLRGKRQQSFMPTIAEFMYDVQPNVRLIVMYRNPVDRLYSAYYYYNKNSQKSPELFHDWALNQVKNMQECLKKHTSYKCARKLYQGSQQLVKGLYSEYVQDWFDVYPKEQILFIKYEDYKKDKKTIIEGVFRHLRVHSPKNWDDILSKGVYNKQKYLPMSNKTRVKLERFYKPYNMKLESMIAKP